MVLVRAFGNKVPVKLHLLFCPDFNRSPNRREAALIDAKSSFALLGCGRFPLLAPTGFFLLINQ